MRISIRMYNFDTPSAYYHPVVLAPISSLQLHRRLSLHQWLADSFDGDELEVISG